jgi:hypothetical protein
MRNPEARAQYMSIDWIGFKGSLPKGKTAILRSDLVGVRALRSPEMSID